MWSRGLTQCTLGLARCSAPASREAGPVEGRPLLRLQRHGEGHGHRELADVQLLQEGLEDRVVFERPERYVQDILMPRVGVGWVEGHGGAAQCVCLLVERDLRVGEFGSCIAG